MGLAFKENCADLRNTRIVDIVAELADYNCCVEIFDPWVSAQDVKDQYGITAILEPTANTYDGIVLAVAHTQFDISASR